MLQAELKILGGKHQGKSIPLSTKKFLVGREQDCHLRPNSDLVSRHHCVFSIDEYAVRLRDLGSTNGTRVNGKPLHGEVMLKSGDQIGIGKLELELVIRQRVAVPDTPAPVLGASASDAEIATTPAITVEDVAIPIPMPSETSFELPTFGAPADDTSTSLTADTTILPSTAPIPGAPLPGTPGQFPAYPGMPVAAYPGYPAGAYPAAPGYPGYPQQPGYPAQYPGYPPGYAAVPGYSMPYSGGYPMPAAPVAAPAPAAAPAAAADPLAVKLPPPESTGVKAPPPPAAPAEGAAAAAPKVEKPSNTAADIIKSYMQKRNR